MTTWGIVAVIAIIFSSLTFIVRISLEYAERIERIKHGYPLSGDVKYEDQDQDQDREDSDFIDYSNQKNSNRQL